MIPAALLFRTIGTILRIQLIWPHRCMPSSQTLPYPLSLFAPNVDKSRMPVQTARRHARSAMTHVPVFVASHTEWPKHVLTLSVKVGRKALAGAHTRSAMTKVCLSVFLHYCCFLLTLLFVLPTHDSASLQSHSHMTIFLDNSDHSDSIQQSPPEGAPEGSNPSWLPFSGAPLVSPHHPTPYPTLSGPSRLDIHSPYSSTPYNQGPFPESNQPFQPNEGLLHPQYSAPFPYSSQVWSSQEQAVSNPTAGPSSSPDSSYASAQDTDLPGHG
jgi:hypothetical protein